MCRASADGWNVVGVLPLVSLQRKEPIMKKISALALTVLLASSSLALAQSGGAGGSAGGMGTGTGIGSGMGTGGSTGMGTGTTTGTGTGNTTGNTNPGLTTGSSNAGTINSPANSTSINNLPSQSGTGTGVPGTSPSTTAGSR